MRVTVRRRYRVTVKRHSALAGGQHEWTKELWLPEAEAYERHVRRLWPSATVDRQVVPLEVAAPASRAA